LKLFRAKARVTDPETSHEAAESVEDISITQERVLSLFLEDGELTDLQLETRYLTKALTAGWKYQTPQSLRSRRAELVKKGRVEFADEWGVSPTGRRARIWKAVK
jgi:hypothetical protein